jgi:carbonic anhydrase/acetyltransferase-like protein (isoleucine patch superfamily)
VDVGAIVIVDADRRTDESPSLSIAELNSATAFAGGTLSFIDLLGRSVLEHIIETLLRAQVNLTSLIVHPDVGDSIPVFRDALKDLTVRVAEDPWPAVAQILKHYWKNGCSCALVAKPTAYIEADFPDLLDFHHQDRRSITRASDGEGPLDLWVMSCDPREEGAGSSLIAALLQPDYFPASYFVKEYVRRLSSPQDFRQLTTDAFLARCSLHPMGEQRRPGIWVDQGVEIRRGARIVGPAYLGARCTIGERAVVTRFSNIERDSYIDYGTVIENSSVLPNTYVGICLDLRRSLVLGNQLLNLERDVLVEVSDPRLLRSNLPVRRSKRPPASVTKPAHEKSLPRATIVNRIRSVSTTTEFES